MRAPAPASIRPSARAAGSTVAFLGLGAMGRPMAMRLVQSGFDVRVYNRTKSVALNRQRKTENCFLVP